MTGGGSPRAGGGRAAVLTGLGAWLPPTVVTNDDLAARLDTCDEWIRTRTGIVQRHIADPGTATSDLAVEAGRRALKSAGDSQVEAVVLATTTPDRLCPATAPEIASRLGLTGCAAFDVSAVCTGFLYGLATSAGLIAYGIAERVLLIGAETYSTIINPQDRSTAVIFADGAGAVVLRAGSPDEPGAIGPVVLGSDGEHADLIQIPAGGARQRSSGRPAAPGDEYFTMRGRETYRKAVEAMVSSSLRALDAAGWSLEQVDRLVAHQANVRILEAVARRLGLPAERWLSNIDRVGNTGAASIPLLLAEAGRLGERGLAPGHRVLLTAFGGGLTWGATTLIWPSLTAA